MGAHKYNPTAIAAKNGELPPKPPKMSKREWERIMDAKCRELLTVPWNTFYVDHQTSTIYAHPKMIQMLKLELINGGDTDAW